MGNASLAVLLLEVTPSPVTAQQELLEGMCKMKPHSMQHHSEHIRHATTHSYIIFESSLQQRPYTTVLWKHLQALLSLTGCCIVTQCIPATYTTSNSINDTPTLTDSTFLATPC